MSTSQRQVARMLALVPYLQGHEAIPVAEVAREFGVSPRQIRDDLKLLMFTGVGEFAGDLIDVDLGALEADGTISIRDAEFMTRPFRPTTREAVALIVALRALRSLAGRAQLPIIDGALATLESAVGEQVSAPVDVVVDTVDPEVHTLLRRGLDEGRRLRIDYAVASRDELTRRLVDPRRIFSRNGNLYLEAWCLRAEDVRFFRLDRVLGAELTDEAVTEHETEPRELASDFFTVGAETPFAVLDLDPDAHWLAEYYQAERVAPGPADAGNDRIRVKLFAADWSWLQRLVLRNAGSVHVVEPLSLAEHVREHARLALAAYA